MNFAAVTASQIRNHWDRFEKENHDTGSHEMSDQELLTLSQSKTPKVKRLVACYRTLRDANKTFPAKNLENVDSIAENPRDNSSVGP